MTIGALLFDLDGTLLDTNEKHVDAWARAFDSRGFRVGRARIAEEIGKSGDQLVGAVLGSDVEASDGDAIRRARDREFGALARSIHFLHGARDLLARARARGLATAVVTNASRADLEHLERAASVELGELVDAVVTREDAEHDASSPDLLGAACAKLERDPLACALVGDSIHDAFAARRAGAAFLGVATGYASREAFARAGARYVARDADALARHLGTALAAASRVTGTLDASLVHELMGLALDAAREALGRREAPIGAVALSASREILGVGRNRACETGDRTIHAEIDALHAVARVGRSTDEAAILVSTLEPCVMCMGAAMELGIDVVICGLEAPDDGGVERVHVPKGPENLLPRIRRGVRRDEARELFRRWLRDVGTREQRAFAESLLQKTHPGTPRSPERLFQTMP